MATTPAETAKTLECLTASLKAPRIREAAARIADTARAGHWSYEEYLTAVLEREVAARNASGARLRITAAGFPAIKTAEDFDFTAQTAITHTDYAAMASGRYLAEAGNIVLLGPPGTGKTHLAIALGICAANHSYPVFFDTATGWITRLLAAHNTGTLEKELRRLRRYRVLIIDEVGYIPFEAEAANLFFQLIANRYEHGTVIVTSNLAFSQWGHTLGDDVIAAASTLGSKSSRS